MTLTRICQRHTEEMRYVPNGAAGGAPRNFCFHFALLTTLKFISHLKNHSKKSHLILRAKRAPFTIWVDKRSLKMPEMVNLASFWLIETCGQTVLPDKSVLIRQKLVEMPKSKNSNETFWVIFKHRALMITEWVLNHWEWCRFFSVSFVHDDDCESRIFRHLYSLLHLRIISQFFPWHLKRFLAR